MLLFFVIGTGTAATINVSSAAALQTAINNANAEDVIILANGTYINSTLSISKSNITVRAATPGGVFWNSDVSPANPANSGVDRIIISGDYITFSGFQFTSGDIGMGIIVQVTGDHNVLTQLNFSGYYAQKYIRLKDGSQYNEVTYCNIEKKPAAAASGCTIQINLSPTVPGFHKIQYCSFQNFFGTGADFGNEPIRIGLSTENDFASKSIVEYCYFNNTGLGDSETISIKSKENTIRFCTFTNQQNAMLTFRNGDNNVAYSNFFINAGGIRVKEANNIYCYNNYFENSGVGSSADAVTLQYVVPVGLRTSNLVNINFIHNTFVNSGSIDLGGVGATSNTWANSIFSDNSGSIFTNENTGTTWIGNIYQGTLGFSILSGMTNTNPLLTLNSDNYFGLSASSPVMKAISGYPAILDIAGIDDDDPALAFDISGQARPPLVTSKDVGADQYFLTGTTTNRPLLLSQVGPSFLGGPGGKLSQTITFNALPSKTVGDADFSAGASASSGLTVSLASSNTAVATIVIGNIHIVGVGTAIITASQLGDGNYNAATEVVQNLTVIGLPHTISFSLPLKYTNSADFDPGAVSSIGSPITYSSSNPLVATIVNNKIHIVAKGTSNITASAVGNGTYDPTTNIQQLIVQCSCVQN
jgi:hypothetical protein